MRKVILLVALLILLAACQSKGPKVKFSDLPAGDAARGAQLFTQKVNGAPNCSSCHLVDGSEGGVGPDMQGFRQRAGDRVEGESAAEYAYNSIIRPAQHVVSGFSNQMYGQYEKKLSTQQITDLMAYLLTL